MWDILNVWAPKSSIISDIFMELSERGKQEEL